MLQLIAGKAITVRQHNKSWQVVYVDAFHQGDVHYIYCLDNRDGTDRFAVFVPKGAMKDGVLEVQDLPNLEVWSLAVEWLCESRECGTDETQRFTRNGRSLLYDFQGLVSYEGDDYAVFVPEEPIDPEDGQTDELIYHCWLDEGRQQFQQLDLSDEREAELERGIIEFFVAQLHLRYRDSDEGHDDEDKSPKDEHVPTDVGNDVAGMPMFTVTLTISGWRHTKGDA